MADPKHLEILKQGGETWNEYVLQSTDPRMDLSSADLKGLDLSGLQFHWVDLSGADLSGTSLIRTNISYSYFVGANLTGADLREARVSFTDFTQANLSLADFTFVYLHVITLDYANLEGAVIGSTRILDNDLSLAKGLDLVFHRQPSNIDVDTLFRSRGKIPEVFLRGCGLPESFITQLPALISAVGPIEFYSCFISYSSKDQEFADRLHADLQNKGVRCWFAPEDLKIGDRFRDRIDESIRLHDKLLLILSENSVTSRWVGDEVEAAFEREQREDRIVLFPIRIDDAVMDSDKAWASTIRRTRHVGDFTRWEEHDSYQKAFDRLLRDLKAEE